MKIGIVVPTNRPENFKVFMEKWNNFYSNSPFLEDKQLVLYLIEDNEKKTIKHNSKITTKHYSWTEIDKDLGKKAWIIPRRSSAIRSYGYYKAYTDGCDYVLTLDDDCFPVEPLSSFINHHLDALHDEKPYSNYHDVGEQFYPETGLKTRGFPFRYRNKRAPVISVGGWDHNPDLDAITQLKEKNPSINVHRSRVIVPKYLGVTICGMNIMFSRKTIPISYFLLQGHEWGIDRWDDIWFGLFFKKIADEFDWPVCINGYANIHHERASQPLKSLYPEGKGYGANELLWDRLIKVDMFANAPLAAYKELAYMLPGLLLYDEEYDKKLSEAMKIWATLFEDERKTK